MRRPPWLQRVLARAVGNRSLHRQLLLWLLLPQLVLWLAAAAVTYNVALRYANRGVDASLLTATRALSRQVKPIGNGLLVDFPRAAQDIIEADPDDRVYYMVSTPPGQFILGNRQLPLPPDATTPRLNEPYFYDAVLDSTRVRLAALYMPIGEPGAAPAQRQVMLVQIARSQASRDELARSILLDTVLPLSGLIALMTMIVWAGIRAGLAPLARLTAQVENRAANDLAPLEPQAAPQEVRTLATALNQLLAAVRESVIAQKRFVSNAAHQLRTPLAGLKSQTEIALEANRDPDLAARLQRVHESAVRSAHLVNQLMALTRAEPEAAASTPRAPVDLGALAAAVAADQVPRALQAGIDLGVEESNQRIVVMGSETLLREAVTNLVDNAIRYAGRDAEVTVSVRSDGTWATLEVADNGVGLPTEPGGATGSAGTSDAPDSAPAHEAIFGRFYRATHVGGGCGLGLAIVREIATRHAGRVWAEPVQPHGLRIRLALPILSSRPS